MRSKLMILALVLFIAALTTSALAQDPIAHYPLLSNTADVTGNHDDMIIEGCTILGGVIVNGSYGSFTCQTPIMGDLNMELLTFTFEFRISGYHSTVMPVMRLGRSYRNLGFEISPEGFAGINVGGGDSTFYPSDVVVTLGEWHTGRISWNSAMGFASCYMDDELIMLAERDPFSPSSDKRFTCVNYANGRVFEGIFRQLKIYNTDVLDVVATQSMSLSAVKNLFE